METCKMRKYVDILFLIELKPNDTNDAKVDDSILSGVYLHWR